MSDEDLSPEPEEYDENELEENLRQVAQDLIRGRESPIQEGSTT